MTTGRPPKYETPGEMQRIIDLYFLSCRARQSDNYALLDDCSEDDMQIINGIEDNIPTISGLAYLLGMTTECLRAYGEKDGFSATVKRAKQRVEMSLEQRLGGAAVTGAIFNLKNNFGWKDKQETEISGGFNVTIGGKDADTL